MKINKSLLNLFRLFHCVHAVLILLFLLLLPALSHGVETPLDLTPEERAWLADHRTIRLYQAYPSRSFLDKDGNFKGLTVDYMTLIGERLGIEVNFVGLDWPMILDKARVYTSLEERVAERTKKQKESKIKFFRIAWKSEI